MNSGEVTIPVAVTEIITSVTDVSQARALPCGTTVGDTYGGRSFSDNVACILESRSYAGWQEIEVGDQRWTVIEIAR
jgi:hypothetical protein